MKKIRKIPLVFRHAGEGFVNDNAFKLSAALSYYTIFALGPLLIIIISLAGMFFGKEAVTGKISVELTGILGAEAALQIENIIKSLHHTQNTFTGAVIGAIVLFVGATGVFTEMQDSINYIWSVRAKPKKSWLKFIINRLLSFSLVLSLGFMLLVSLLVNALLSLLSDKMNKLLPHYSFSFVHFVDQLLIVVVIVGLFTVIFKILPDATIAWRDALVGSAITTLLFMLGKSLIGYYLSKLHLDITYGAAASIIVLLSWVYYSAMILYFGAEFTKAYALQAGAGIHPKDTAVFIIKRESKEITESHLI